MNPAPWFNAYLIGAIASLIVIVAMIDWEDWRKRRRTQAAERRREQYMRRELERLAHHDEAHDT